MQHQHYAQAPGGHAQATQPVYNYGYGQVQMPIQGQAQTTMTTAPTQYPQQQYVQQQPPQQQQQSVANTSYTYPAYPHGWAQHPQTISPATTAHHPSTPVAGPNPVQHYQGYGQHPHTSVYSQQQQQPQPQAQPQIQSQTQPQPQPQPQHPHSQQQQHNPVVYAQPAAHAVPAAPSPQPTTQPVPSTVPGQHLGAYAYPGAPQPQTKTPQQVAEEAIKKVQAQLESVAAEGGGGGTEGTGYLHGSLIGKREKERILKAAEKNEQYVQRKDEIARRKRLGIPLDGLVEPGAAGKGGGGGNSG
ncbi:unnamed protein product, partial [Choristocarpus tenellus]